MLSSLHIRRLLSLMSNPQHRGGVFGPGWSRKLGKEIAIAAVGLTILFFIASSTFDSWWKGRHSGMPTPFVSDLVDLTLVRHAKEKGAVCLDGSPPAYHFQRGFGSGSISWHVHIERIQNLVMQNCDEIIKKRRTLLPIKALKMASEISVPFQLRLANFSKAIMVCMHRHMGGGWCDTLESCASRRMTQLGSSDQMDHQILFTGMFSSDKRQNPDLFNWNKVRIRYCDGASFSGNLKSEVQNGTKILFRGQRIWEAVMDELLSIGLADAKQALLSGCSAGGLATLIHCDDFRARLPKSATVKCLSDGGFFLDEKDIAARSTMQSFYHDVVHLQGVEKSLNKKCTSQMEPSQCFFPEQIVKNIQTPVFIVNSAYDFWQIKHVLVPGSSDPKNSWASCKLNIISCNSNQIQVLQGFRTALLNALKALEHNKDVGMFITSCYIHCQTWMPGTWHSISSPRINNKTIAEAVGDWYFNRRVVKEIDCPYPCNPTCLNMVFD